MSPFLWRTTLELAESSGNVSDVTKADIINNVSIRTVGSRKQVSQMIDPDPQKILIYRNASSLLEPHLNASS